MPKEGSNSHKSMKERREVRKKKFLKSLESTLGIVQAAAVKCGINRKTHYDWYNNDPEYKKQADDILNIALDFAEAQLVTNLKAGKEASLFFYLKNKGKNKGWGDEVTVNNNTKITKEVFLLNGKEISFGNAEEDS